MSMTRSAVGLVAVGILCLILAQPPLQLWVMNGLPFIILVGFGSLAVLVGGVRLGRSIVPNQPTALRRVLVRLACPFGLTAIWCAYLVTIGRVNPREPFVVVPLVAAAGSTAAVTDHGPLSRREKLVTGLLIGSGLLLTAVYYSIWPCCGTPLS